MRKIAAALLVVLFLSASSCEKTESDVKPDDNPVVNPVDGNKPQPGVYTLPLIETTDTHGHIVTTDNDAVHYRMAFIADKVNDIRGNDRDRLVLLDGGDLYQGASVSNLLDGMPVYVSIDRMGYDAVALGNHEFDWDFDTLVDDDATLLDYNWDGRHYDNYVPILCANLYQNGERSQYTQDYIILDKTAVDSKGHTVKVKIGVVGFVPNYSSSIMASRFGGKGYSIKEDYSIANEIATSLEASGQCDATIFLIHGGADDAAGHLGYGSAFDLVLGGHTHRAIAGKSGWGVPYMQGGRYCEQYAYLDLKFTVDDTGAVTFTKVDNMKFCAVDSYRDRHRSAEENADDLDEEILAISDYALQATEAQQKDVIGYINVGATTSYISGSGDRASNMSNWMCDIIRRIGEADVAFVNSGGIRTSLPLNGQSRRDITVADVYEIFPFCNTVYVYDITYADLLKVFKYSMSGGSGLFSRVTGIDCYYTQDYSIHSLKKDGTVIYQNGSWTGDWASRKVLLAVSEYIATSGAGSGNPLASWNNSSRLISSDIVDNAGAVRVLREEAASSGGLLHIDTTPHFILK